MVLIVLTIGQPWLLPLRFWREKSRLVPNDMTVLLFRHGLDRTSRSLLALGWESIVMVDDPAGNHYLDALRQRTTRRRGQRSRRTRTLVLLGLATLAILVLVLPSIAAHTSIGHSMVQRIAAGYGFDVRVDTMQFGWITPIRLDGVEVVGASGATKATIETVQTEIRILDCIKGLSSLGAIRLGGIQSEIAIDHGRSSLEDDLSILLADDADGKGVTGQVEIHDANVLVRDLQAATQWFVGNVDVTVDMSAALIDVHGSAVLTDPQHANGAIEFALQLPAAASTYNAGQAVWTTEVQMRNVPLHIVTLVKSRFPESAGGLPDQLSGDATGTLHASQLTSGPLITRFQQLEVRKLVASDKRLGTRTWTNELAQVDGTIRYVNNGVTTEGLRAAADFGHVTMSGTVPLPSGSLDPLAWMQTINGSGSLDLDLVRLDRSAPGLLPLRADTQLIDGRVLGKIDSRQGDDGIYRTVCSLRTTPMRARSGNRNVTLEPLTANATIALRDGLPNAEQIRVASAFGSASGQGDLRAGKAEFDVDFNRLALMLQPLVTLPDAGLRGIARGSLSWAAAQGNQWNLKGDFSARDLNLQMPSGQVLRQPQLAANLQATGIWDGETLTELTRFQSSLQGDGHRWSANLRSAVARPTEGNVIPLRIEGAGDGRSVAQLAAPWLPADLKSVEGNFQLQMVADVAQDRGQVRSVDINWQQPRIVWGTSAFSQPGLIVKFEGAYKWPLNVMTANTLTLESEAFTMAAAGHSSSDAAEMELGWRFDLQRLQNAVRPVVTPGPPAPANRPIQPVSYTSAAPAGSLDQYRFAGRSEGRATVSQQDGIWSIDTDAQVTNFSLSRLGTGVSQGFTGPIRLQASARNSAPAPSLLWNEPSGTVRGILRYDARTGGAVVDHVQVTTRWFNTVLDGHVIWNTTQGEVKLMGPTEVNMAQISQQLSELAGQSVRLEGTHKTPLEIEIQRQPNDELAIQVLGSVGWQKGKIADINFGPSVANLDIREIRTVIAPTTIPMQMGQLNVGGTVHYENGHLWLEQQPGRFAENIRLEPQMARQWLKYVAPLAADATEMSGMMSLDFTECVIVPDQADQSRVAGQLVIQGFEMNAGPLANQVIQGVEQIKNISRGVTAMQASARPRRLVTVRGQVVDFDLRGGVVSHQRMIFNVDDASVITSGSVSLAGDLNLTAQVPLEARWLGSNLQSLAGQSVTLPIRGSLARPRLDGSAITQTIRSLGSQAVQQSAENYLQQQMNRGLERLLGR